MNSIVEKLIKNADLNYKKYNENLIGKNSPIIGIRIPELRKITKELINKNRVDNFLKTYEGVYFEEKLIKGLIIASHESYFNEYVDEYIKTLDSWCLVDTFCNSCKFINNNKERYWNFVKKLIESQEEFVIRTGYVFILNYYLSDDYIDEIVELLCRKFDFYYVNMAIAWCISEAYIKYSMKMENLLNKKVLSEFVQNKAIDKINDSYRVDRESKVRLRVLKYF